MKNYNFIGKVRLLASKTFDHNIIKTEVNAEIRLLVTVNMVNHGDFR